MSRREPERAGSAWDPLYRIGAVCAALAVASYAAALIIVATTETPPASGGAGVLSFVAEHRTVYIIRQILWLAPSVLLMVVFLALTVALRRRTGLAAVAGLVAISSWAMSLAWPTTGDGAPAMVVLSDRYAAATTAAQKAPFVAGAEVLLALNDVPAVIGVLQTLGILLVALLMRQGPFATGLAWLGIATGVIGVLAELFRPVLGGAYAAYGLLLFAWLGWVAVALWRHPVRP